MKQHRASYDGKISFQRNLTSNCTAEIAKAAACAVVLDLRPMSFTDHDHEGIKVMYVQYSKLAKVFRWM